MIWGWIVAALILVLLATVLFAPLRCIVLWRTKSTAQVTLRWLWFRVPVFPPPEKAEKKDKPERKHKKAKIPDTKADEPEAFSQKLAQAVSLLSALREPFGVLLRRFRFYVIRLDMIVARENAAETAIAYGRVNAMIYGTYAVAKNIFNLGNPQFSIRPSYTAEAGDAILELRGRVAPAELLYALLKFVVSYAKSAKHQDTTNKQSQNVEK